VKQAEVDLEYLSLLLGIINSQTSLNKVENNILVGLESFITKDMI